MTISSDSARSSKTSWIGRIAGTVALAIAFAIAASPASALAKKKKASDDNDASSGVAVPAQTGTVITKCETISTAGLYTLTTGGISTAIMTGTCISVTASRITINLAGQTITDTTSGNTATGISITGNTNDFLEGANGSVTGFGTADISVDPGSYAYVDSVNVGGSAGAGILAAGPEVSISSIFSGSNKYGVEFDGCTNCSLNFGEVTDNSSYGIWVNNSDQTAVNAPFADANTTAGIYVGCATTPGGTCSSHGSETKIYNGESDSNKYGIYLESLETLNNVAYTIGSSNTTDDAYSPDTTCTNTNWFENTFTKTNLGSSCNPL